MATASTARDRKDPPRGRDSDARGEHKANMIRSRAVQRRSRNEIRSWRMVPASEPLSQLEVLVVDCQATSAAPRGHLLEIGWAQVRDTVAHAQAYLIALPNGEQIPPAVSRITGISEHMLQAGVDSQVAWRALSDHAASLAQ